MMRDQVRNMLFKPRRWGDRSIWQCIKRHQPVEWQLEFLIDELVAEIARAEEINAAAAAESMKKPKATSKTSKPAKAEPKTKKSSSYNF